jgi:hypothetical protein
LNLGEPPLGSVAWDDGGRKRRHPDAPFGDGPAAVPHPNELQVTAGHFALLERHIHELEFQPTELDDARSTQSVPAISAVRRRSRRFERQADQLAALRVSRDAEAVIVANEGDNSASMPGA